jgi:hypothetical protein
MRAAENLSTYTISFISRESEYAVNIVVGMLHTGWRRRRGKALLTGARINHAIKFDYS